MPVLPRQALAGAIGLLILLRFVAAAVLPLSADEAYYWLWSHHLGAGYLDHPPSIAWCIRFGTAIFGHTSFGVRVVPIALSIPASWFVWRAGAIFLEDDEAGLYAALLFNLTLMVAVEMLAATPDGPAAACSAAFLYAVAKLMQTEDGRWWLAAGVAAGLGLLAKYTILFLGLGALIWLIASPDARRWWTQPWPYAGGLLALALFAPNLWWNATHHWETFAFQFGRIGTSAFTLRYLAEFLGGQIVLATPFILVLSVLGLGVAVSERRLGFLAALVGSSTIYFAVHALHARVEGNWPSFLYPELAVLAIAAPRAEWGRRMSAVVRASGRLAIPAAATMLVLAYLQAFFAIAPLGRTDPLSRLLGFGVQDAALSIEAVRARTGAAAIFTTDYETAAWLAFYRPSPAPIVALGEETRWSWAQPAPRELVGQPGLYVVELKKDMHASLASQFAKVEPAGEVERKRGSAAIAQYKLYRVEGARTGDPAHMLP